MNQSARDVGRGRFFFVASAEAARGPRQRMKGQAWRRRLHVSMFGRGRLVRVAYWAVLVGGLGAAQIRAEILQWRSGYRPLARAPVRIPYSWDMFAIRMDRCVVTWDPPLTIEGQPVGSWHDRAYPFEFDTIFNEADQYLAIARYACTFRGAAPTEAHVVCALSEGRIDERRFDCP